MVTLSIMFIFGSNPAYSAMDDLSVSVGAMSWYNKYVPISRIGGADVPKSTYAFMNGPIIKVKYKDLYFGATYLLSSNNYELVVTNSPLGVHHASANSSASRSDLDFVAGYMLTPILGLNVGYKGIFVNDNLTLVSQGVARDAKRYDMYNLGTFGVGLNIPLWTNFTWIFNGNALLGSYHNDVSYPAYYKRLNEPEYNAMAWGISTDTSIDYNIIYSLSANIGLKFQYTKAGSDNSNSFGPTFGLDYRF